MIGVKKTAIYQPTNVETARDLEAKTSIPEEIIIKKFGLKEKRIAAKDEHASDLAIKAGEQILRNVDKDSIDVVIYFGSPHKDYLVWSCAPKIVHELGLKHAYGFEIMNVSSCFPIALKVAKDMLVADKSIQNILLAGGCKESQIIDYANERSRFMFNFADGGAAALISRDSEHEILGSGMITDGSFHDDVYVPAGGSANPASHQTVDEGMHFIDVKNPKSMKDRLDPVTVPNFLKSIHIALEKSGLTAEDIDWLLPLHTKRSLFQELISQLGLKEEQGIYLDEYGHMSALDPCYGFEILQRKNLVKKDDVIVTVSAGTGYTWASTVIRW